MGIINSLITSVKNSLRWRAQSTLTGGVDKGIQSVTKLFTGRCPKCGKPTKETGATFCANCGASLVTVCKNSNCGRQLPLGTKFCSGCGSNLQKKSAEAEKS